MLIEQCPFINIRPRLGKFLYSKYATCVSTSSFSEYKNDYYKLDKDSISWELSRIDFQRDWIVAAAADVEETEEMFLNYFLCWHMKDGSYIYLPRKIMVLWPYPSMHPVNNPSKYKSPPKSPTEKCAGKRHTFNSCFLLLSFAILMMLGLISIMDIALHNSSSSCRGSAEFPTVARADTIKYVEICGYFMLWINNHMESYLQY